MITEKIQAVLQALQDGGIPAQRSFPGRRQPQVDGPVAAVYLQAMDPDTVSLGVQVFCPPESGGSLCEDTAVQAMETLNTLGARCKLGACRYDRTAGLFSLEICAEWPLTAGESGGSDCSVSINGSPLPYVTGFSCKESADLQQIQAIGEGTVEVRRENVHRILTVEELLPGDLAPAEPESFNFTLTVTRSGGTETYTLCYWESILRQETPQGIRQLRVARSWGERRFGNG